MSERLHHYKRGLWAEIIAAFYLICRGYRLKAWRYKTHHGEIDLIAVKNKTVIFIEVKARSTYIDGVEAISPKSQSRIQNAAAHFIARHPRYQNYVWRFDVVVVRPNRLPYHLKDAWRPV